MRKKRSSAKRPHKRTPPRAPNVNVGDAFPPSGSCCEKNVHFCRVALPQRLATLKFGARGCQRPRWTHKDDERFFRKHRYPIHGRFPTLKGPESLKPQTSTDTWSFPHAKGRRGTRWRWRGSGGRGESGERGAVNVASFLDVGDEWGTGMGRVGVRHQLLCFAI